jgi:hypothetical protein
MEKKTKKAIPDNNQKEAELNQEERDMYLYLRGGFTAK